MGKTKLKGVLVHLKPERAALLKELALEKRTPKSVLMREAIDDLLSKYGKLKRTRKRTP